MGPPSSRGFASTLTRNQIFFTGLIRDPVRVSCGQALTMPITILDLTVFIIHRHQQNTHLNKAI